MLRGMMPPMNKPTRRRPLIFGALGALALMGGGTLAWRATSRRAGLATRSDPTPGPAASPTADPATASPANTTVADPVDVYALTLPDLAGQPQRLSHYLGHPLLVNFWATWCAPCVKEMPALDALAREHPRVQFVGIGIDTAANMRDFVAKVPVAYPLLVAGYEGVDLLRALGNPAGGLPFTVLFDASGEPVRQILGEVEVAELAGVLMQLG